MAQDFQMIESNVSDSLFVQPQADLAFIMVGLFKVEHLHGAVPFEDCEKLLDTQVSAHHRLIVQ